MESLESVDQRKVIVDSATNSQEDSHVVLNASPRLNKNQNLKPAEKKDLLKKTEQKLLTSR